MDGRDRDFPGQNDIWRLLGWKASISIKRRGFINQGSTLSMRTGGFLQSSGNA